MPVFSKVLNASFNLARNSPKIINTGNGLMVNQLKSQLFQVQTRGSHGRTMFIRPGKFYTKKFADIIVRIIIILQKHYRFINESSTKAFSSCNWRSTNLVICWLSKFLCR